MAGLARAREEGTSSAVSGSRTWTPRRLLPFRSALTAKTGIRRIARDLGVGVGTCCASAMGLPGKP